MMNINRYTNVTKVTVPNNLTRSSTTFNNTFKNMQNLTSVELIKALKSS